MSSTFIFFYSLVVFCLILISTKLISPIYYYRNIIFDYLFNLEEVSNFLLDFSVKDNEKNEFEVLEKLDITFKDVAGNEEAKNELEEVVKFLQNSERFLKLGAKTPKGILLAGPPGTGKTLLAKAIAGEAGTSFLKVSGSQFVELLVGVGASRVRKLFQIARNLKPAIIFIDEIDAIAKSRSEDMISGNDEREQTLNQILTEMDGFEPDIGILVIGATNRIDILDSAILRPGRFDRQISIQMPNLKEREEILKVHVKKKLIDKSISLSLIAQRTIGFSGSDLANLINEAAILAVRRNKKQITLEEINDSIDKLLFGFSKKPLNRSKIRHLTGFKEMGSSFLSMLVQNKTNFEKISLISNSKNSQPFFSESYNSRKTFIKQVLVLLASRAAENLIAGSSETSILNKNEIIDLTTNLRIMVRKYAMIRLQESKQESQQRNLYIVGNDIKEELTNMIDIFLIKFIYITYQEILYFLKNTRPISEKIVDELLRYEELTTNELKLLLNEYFLNLEPKEIISLTKDSATFEIFFNILKKFRKRRKVQNLK